MDQGLEEFVAEMSSSVPQNHVERRGLGLMLLAGDESLERHLISAFDSALSNEMASFDKLTQ